MTASTGRAWVFGDHIDTDALAPGIYLKQPVTALAKHCLESVNPTFAALVTRGDIVVAGENFGLGSSREQAAEALKALGVAAVLAVSFARIFYRNALNLGLPALIVPPGHRIADGDRLRVNPAAGLVEDLTAGTRIRCQPIPPHLMAMIADGGLLPHLKKRLAAEIRR